MEDLLKAFYGGTFVSFKEKVKDAKSSHHFSGNSTFGAILDKIEKLIAQQEQEILGNSEQYSLSLRAAVPIA